MDTPYFKQAVEKAQTAGYDVKWDESLVCFIGGDFTRCLTQKEIYSDRLFWVCLGNSMGWEREQYDYQVKDGWLTKWHRFIDHLAEEKYPEEFFEKILNEKTI